VPEISFWNFLCGIWRWLMTKRHYRISPRLLLALEALGSGAADTVAEAADVAGLTERAIRYALKKDHVRSWLRQHVATTFAAGQLAASKTMMGLLKSENSMSQFRAAAWIFGVNGISPVDNRGPLVSLNVQAGGYIIDLRDDPDNAAPLTAEDQAALQKSSAGAVLLGSTRRNSS
jgi:hypothetical protein